MRKDSWLYPILVLALAALSLAVSPAVAQMTTGGVTGKVVDEKGAPLPGVLVTLRNVDTGIERGVTSNAEGAYTILGLPPAIYVAQATVNSIHHQAVKDLGRDLIVEALAIPDGIVEAIRWRGPSYVFGMQWHPEFLAQRELHMGQLDGRPILQDFLRAVRSNKKAHAQVAHH